MDSLITAAARALAAGDALGALNRIALRDDAAALALRGIAMAQLGDLARARALIRRAARAFGAKAPVARARCSVADAEIALAARELSWPVAALDAARATLDQHADRRNAAHARQLQARRLLLLGQVDGAERALAGIESSVLSAAARATHDLIVAGIAIRRYEAGAAHAALARARVAATEAGIAGLIAEVDGAVRVLQAPAARVVERARQRLVLLGEVATLRRSPAVIVDACDHSARHAGRSVSLARRPILFALLRSLAEAWPADVARAVLIAQAFRARSSDDSHRARLRVEIGRLRTLLREMADVRATRHGFVLVPHAANAVVVLAPPLEDRHAGVLVLLADGESWSSSALALALGASQRSVQRALDTLDAAGKVQAFGRGRGRRWILPSVPGFTTTLLLPVSLPGD